MFGKYRFSFISAVVGLLIAMQCDAFELFPRPEGSPHAVQRGDTLFSLSDQFYGNSELWPFLWNQNPQIKLGDGSGPPEQRPLQRGQKIDLYDVKNPYTIFNQTYKPPIGIPEDLEFLTRKTPYKGIPYDKKYFSFKLSPRPTQVWGYIVDSPESYKSNFLERDLVYIRVRPSKKHAILVGDRFGIYREHGPVPHPVNRDRSVGYSSQIVGEIEITSTGNDLLTAIVLESFVEIVKGDKICLYAPRPCEIVPTKTHRMLTGTILEAAHLDTLFGRNYSLENDVVFVDRGECDGMREGMLINIYRPGGLIPDPHFGRTTALPDTHIGEGMVLKAFDGNSSVLITFSREEIQPGDIVKSVSD